ncbi:hypothetical protein COCNU_scaffold009941G000010 [Cocos nucifera]|nr:hypothetical protein [Cocos nucifera]
MVASSRRGGHGDEHHGVEVDRNDYMDVGMEEVDKDASGHLSETDSETKAADEILKPVQPPQRCADMLQGCRSVDEFERPNKIDEGTYGVVYRAKNKKTGEVVGIEEGVKYVHDNSVLHRDLKMSNLLLNNRGELKKIFRTFGTPNEKIWPGFAKLPGVKVNFVKQP